MNASDVAMLPTSQKYPHLARAPIVEAIIEWQVKLDPNFAVESLKQAGDALGSDYVLAREQRGFQYKVKEAGKQLSHTTQDLGIQGYQFRSADTLRVASLKQDSFSFSRLKPYSRWEDVFGEAQELWKIYRNAAQPEEISRLGVRYINRIPLPMPVGDFSQFLKQPFAVPQGIPQDLTNLLTRVIVHEPSNGVAVNIIQLIEGEIVEGTLPFILDIDAYHQKHIDPNLESFSLLFEQLREMKNRVFFATLSDSTIEMFK